ncbi:Oligosaccharide 4-alpha-D-glucosyltransferase [Neolewinella maritima]|uniref:Oligosaccharide 4-alpha-D-glucosyltransferase n=1 Tax=Neolewinella maritima TaxID=1383882 RepID=A0ABN8F661_9BACT|nr:TIM-barrel domain-containing protein [Neolewinella maritima]CAH1000418.1 Oligosaccharide 4-alpha-D-glucosyltransferase [Neolewinella maritima]
MTKMKKVQPQLPYAAEAGLVNESKTVNTLRYEDVYYDHQPGRVTSVEREGTQTFVLASAGKLGLRIEVWSDDVIRFFYTFGGQVDDFSYARDPQARIQAASIEFEQTDTHSILTTANLELRVRTVDSSVSITARDSGQLLHEYAAPFYARTTLLRGLDQMRLQFKTDREEGFFGLGDKAWDTDLNGRCLDNWCSDSFAYGRERDALYRAIPFFYGLRDGSAYGVFVDNSYRSHFDFNSNRDDLATVWTEGGEFDYYFINGPALDQVAQRYAQLTGLPELPPLWALGYHQCRWSYYPESRVKELAATFRDKNIPCDAIYLDIDYMDGYRCFTWNKDYFPDPKQMISELRDDGFHTVVMIDPGIRVDEDYPVYTDGIKQDAFCRRSTGEQMIGPVWPSECVWPDYTDPDVRDWWGQLYHELYVEQGVSGFWNDMNEPAMFKVNSLTFPLDVRHDFDGHGGDHKKAHNIYGMQMTRATHDGLKALQPAKRPFLLARANFSGGQRYASLWTGDNVASWEHLALANSQSLRLAISGYSFVGSDIGGFVDDPSPELLTRWLQLAVFHPLMRVHSMGNNTDGAAETENEEVKKAERENRQDQEPWVHGGEHTRRNRLAIEMRYQLLPYLYTAFHHHIATGTPVLRNLFFYDQHDPRCREYGDQFLAGNDLLVCPVIKPGIKTMNIYLPRGEWYDFWTGKLHAGQQKLRARVKADRLPIFVRAGAVLPTVEAVQHTAALQRLDTLHLSLFLADRGEGTLYWDAGEGYGYQIGQHSTRSYRVERSGQQITLSQVVDGQFNASFTQANIRLVGLTHAPGKVTVDGELLPHALQFDQRTASVVVPFNFRTVTIE